MKKSIIYMFLFFTLIFVQMNVPYAAKIERVILISIDSLNNYDLFNKWVNPDFIYTPNIGELVRSGAYFTDATGVLPSMTQVNNVSMICGCYPEKMGITGNLLFDRNKKMKGPAPYIHPFKHPEYIKSDTIFLAMERKDKNYKTAVVSGKNFVGCPIWADYTVGPDCISESVKKEFPEIKKFPEMASWNPPDNWVLDNALTIMRKVDLNFLFLHFGFLDCAQHFWGQGAQETWAVISWVDYQIGKLIKFLKDTDRFRTTLLVVTSDHGQSNVWVPFDLKKFLKKKGIDYEFFQSESSMMYIFLKNKDDIQRTVSALKELDYVDGIWYGDSIDDIHLRTPYTGDVVFSIKPPYDPVVFSSPYLTVMPPHIGSHGGVKDIHVPLIFFGPGIKRGAMLDELQKASLVDIVPTVTHLAGLPLPEDSQGKVLQVEDEQLDSEAPSISYHLNLKTDEKFKSLFTSLFLVLSLLLLFSYYKTGCKGELPNLGHGIILILCKTFSICSLYFIQFLRMFAVTPGIYPDEYLLAKRTFIWGTPILIHPLNQLGTWFAFCLIFGGLLALISKLMAKGSFKKIFVTFPTVLLPWIILTLLMTVVNILFKLHYSTITALYYVVFWGGFYLACVAMIFNVKRITGTTFVKSFIIVLLVAVIFNVVVFHTINNPLLKLILGQVTLLPGFSY